MPYRSITVAKFTRMPLNRVLIKVCLTRSTFSVVHTVRRTPAGLFALVYLLYKTHSLKVRLRYERETLISVNVEVTPKLT